MPTTTADGRGHPLRAEHQGLDNPTRRRLLKIYEDLWIDMELDAMDTEASWRSDLDKSLDSITRQKLAAAREGGAYYIRQVMLRIETRMLDLGYTRDKIRGLYEIVARRAKSSKNQENPQQK